MKLITDLASGNLVLLIVVVICIALIILDIVLLIRMGNLRRRLDMFLTGSDGASLEEAFSEKFDKIEYLTDRDEEKSDDISMLNLRLKGAFQKSGIVRYDAYTESGGNLSFALALLDEADSGFVLNVMNGRDGSYCYIKEIYRGESEISLGNEEIEAIEIAMMQKKRK